jgi:hypothetical protein
MDNREYVNLLLEAGRFSNSEITKYNLKDRFLRPFFPTIIIENFYEDPDLVRNFALKQEYFKGERGSWPGLRSSYVNEISPSLYENLKRKLLLIISDYGFKDFTELQTSFQLIDETYGTGWVHDDDPKLNIAGLIYLNPEPPYQGSGTTLYEDKDDFDSQKYAEPFMQDVLLCTDDERTKFKNLREEQRNQFKPTVSIENVYNRCILFDTRTWHSADGFFGRTKDDTRLTQVFFLKAV